MMRRAQTLLELVIAAGVISIAAIAVITLIIRTIDVGQQTIKRTEAANYAREGIEAVRMIRDSNWLLADQNTQLCNDLVPWNYDGTVPLTNITDCTSFNGGDHHLVSGEYIPLLNLNSVWQLYQCPGTCTAAQKQLYSLTTGTPPATSVRQYAGTVTSGSNKIAYSRVLTITLRSEDVTLNGTLTSLPYLDVVSTVTWNSVSASTNSITVEERLYNWR